MTTTLRPTGPEQRGDGGARSRSYDICVNSRPVGIVRLATDARHGPGTGRIQQLVVDEREQRRGRGTVAALAAEEVLRGWGCRRVALSVPADAVAARHLTAALGYRESRRQLRKRLGDEPALPAGYAARPMTDGEYAERRQHWLRLLADRLRAEGVPRERAAGEAAEDLRALLPAGLGTGGAVLRVLAHGDGPAADTGVGFLWLSVGPEAEHPDGEADAYAYDVEVFEGARGRGHGRVLMLLAEGEALAAGCRTLGLSVEADNPVARKLYASLDYQPVRLQYAKPL